MAPFPRPFLLVVVVVAMTAFLDNHHFLVMAPPAVQTAVVIVIAVRLDDDRSLRAGAGSAERHCNADGRERGKHDSKFTHDLSSKCAASIPV